jgi:3-phenylpropionate/trans-cinnamate dioxygenase ferredoxin subunit
MAEWKIIADECDVVKGKPVEVIFEGKVILLIKLDDAVLGFEGLCPHQKSRLVFGTVDETWLHCPQHQAKFRLSDGVCGPGWILPPLKTYKIKVDNGKIFSLFDD